MKIFTFDCDECMTFRRAETTMVRSCFSHSPRPSSIMTWFGNFVKTAGMISARSSTSGDCLRKASWIVSMSSRALLDYKHCLIRVPRGFQGLLIVVVAEKEDHVKLFWSAMETANNIRPRHSQI